MSNQVFLSEFSTLWQFRGSFGRRLRRKLIVTAIALCFLLLLNETHFTMDEVLTGSCVIRVTPFYVDRYFEPGVTGRFSILSGAPSDLVVDAKMDFAEHCSTQRYSTAVCACGSPSELAALQGTCAVRFCLAFLSILVLFFSMLRFGWRIRHLRLEAVRRRIQLGSLVVVSEAAAFKVFTALYGALNILLASSMILSYIQIVDAQPERVFSSYPTGVSGWGSLHSFLGSFHDSRVSYDAFRFPAVAMGLMFLLSGLIQLFGCAGSNVLATQSLPTGEARQPTDGEEERNDAAVRERKFFFVGANLSYVTSATVSLVLVFLLTAARQNVHQAALAAADSCQLVWACIPSWRPPVTLFDVATSTIATASPPSFLPGTSSGVLSQVVATTGTNGTTVPGPYFEWRADSRILRQQTDSYRLITTTFRITTFVLSLLYSVRFFLNLGGLINIPLILQNTESRRSAKFLRFFYASSPLNHVAEWLVRVVSLAFFITVWVQLFGGAVNWRASSLDATVACSTGAIFQPMDLRTLYSRTRLPRIRGDVIVNACTGHIDSFLQQVAPLTVAVVSVMVLDIAIALFWSVKKLCHRFNRGRRRRRLQSTSPWETDAYSLAVTPRLQSPEIWSLSHEGSQPVQQQQQQQPQQQQRRPQQPIEVSEHDLTSMKRRRSRSRSRRRRRRRVRLTNNRLKTTRARMRTPVFVEDPPSQCPSLGAMPDLVLCEIAMVSPDVASRLSLVCKRIHRVIHGNQSVWRALCASRWGDAVVSVAEQALQRRWPLSYGEDTWFMATAYDELAEAESHSPELRWKFDFLDSKRCPFCKFTAVVGPELRLHVSLWHPSRYQRWWTRLEESTLLCYSCGSEFKNRKSFANHSADCRRSSVDKAPAAGRSNPVQPFDWHGTAALPPSRVLCTECYPSGKRYFSTFDDLLEHFRSAHPGVDAPASADLAVGQAAAALSRTKTGAVTTLRFFPSPTRDTAAVHSRPHVFIDWHSFFFRRTAVGTFPKSPMEFVFEMCDEPWKIMLCAMLCDTQSAGATRTLFSAHETTGDSQEIHRPNSLLPLSEIKKLICDSPAARTASTFLCFLRLLSAGVDYKVAMEAVEDEGENPMEKLDDLPRRRRRCPGGHTMILTNLSGESYLIQHIHDTGSTNWHCALCSETFPLSCASYRYSCPTCSFDVCLDCDAADAWEPEAFYEQWYASTVNHPNDDDDDDDANDNNVVAGFQDDGSIASVPLYACTSLHKCPFKPIDGALPEGQNWNCGAGRSVGCTNATDVLTDVFQCSRQCGFFFCCSCFSTTSRPDWVDVALGTMEFFFSSAVPFVPTSVLHWPELDGSSFELLLDRILTRMIRVYRALEIIKTFTSGPAEKVCLGCAHGQAETIFQKASQVALDADFAVSSLLQSQLLDESLSPHDRASKLLSCYLKSKGGTANELFPDGQQQDSDNDGSDVDDEADEQYEQVSRKLLLNCMANLDSLIDYKIGENGSTAAEHGSWRVDDAFEYSNDFAYRAGSGTIRRNRKRAILLHLCATGSFCSVCARQFMAIQLLLLRESFVAEAMSCFAGASRNSTNATSTTSSTLMPAVSNPVFKSYRRWCLKSLKKK